MESVVQRPVEFAFVGALEHHREVFAVFPVSLRAELFGHTFVKSGAWQRIGNRDADIVGLDSPNELNGFLDVLPLLTRIAKLDKETEIGRASCRERVESSVDDVSIKKK